MDIWEQGGMTFISLGARPRRPEEIVVDAVNEVVRHGFAVLWSDDHQILTFCNRRDDFRVFRFDDDGRQLPSLEVPITPEVLTDFTDNVWPTIMDTNRLMWLENHDRACTLTRLHIEEARREAGMEHAVDSARTRAEDPYRSPEYRDAYRQTSAFIAQFLDRHGATEMTS